MEINKGERTEIKVTNGTVKFYQERKEYKQGFDDFDRQETGTPEGHMMPRLFTLTCVLLPLIRVMTYRCGVTFGGA